MAARKKRGVGAGLDKEWRERIKASQLMNRLTDNALADEEIMTAGQIRSAEILLRKVIPDLKQTEHVGQDGQPLTMPTAIILQGVTSDPKDS